MRISSIALTGALILAACAKKDSQVAVDSTSRDIQLPKADSTLALNDAPSTTPKVDTVYVEKTPAPAPPPAPPARPKPRPSPPPAAVPAPVPPAAAPSPPPAPPPAPRVSRLEAGTVVETRATKLITSRTNKPGETFTVRVDSALTDASGRVVIPAGAEVTLTIVALKPAANKSAKDGIIDLRATSVLINGESRPIDAEVTYVEHTLKGRGVTGSEAVKVGAGAAAGAIIGKIIGGGTGAVVGGVTGAAAGTAVAVESADRDVVVPVGGKIKLALRSPFGSGS
jgi:hypothetical protein